MQIVRKKFGFGLLSLFSTYAIGGMLKTNSNYYTLSNSIISVIVFFALFSLYTMLDKINISRRLWAVSSVIGSLFSFWLAIGPTTLMADTTGINHITTWVKILCGIPLITALMALFFAKGVPNANHAISSTKITEKLDWLFSSKKGFFMIWLLIFVAWMPSLIASYPGIYGYDSVYQVGYYLSGKIYLHHPLVDTYLIGFCVVTLAKVFGSREIGMLIYSLVQMSILSFAFTAIITYMTKRKITVWARVLFLLIFMFLPVNPLMAFSATKDIIYSATFALVVMLMLMLAHQPKVLFKKRFILVFSLVVFVNIIFRSQGIYVFLFSSVFGLFYLRKYWKRMLIIIVLPLLMYTIYSGPVTKALGGVKFDSIHEMMSVPAVQLSRALYYDNDELTAHQHQQIKNYIPDYALINGNAGIADGMKNTFNTPLFRKNPINFVKLWVQVGLKKPLVYADAFSRLTIGLWYPDMNYRDPQGYHPYWEYISSPQNAQGTFYTVKRQTPASMKWLSNLYNKLTYSNSYQKIPVVSMLFSSGFYVWAMFCYIAWCVYVKRYCYLYPASLVFGLWLTLLLGPVVLYRYVFPIAISLPLFFAEAITAEKANKLQDKRD